MQEHRTLQLFYTFKAIVCILLNREVGGVNPHIELLDCVSIADWNFQSAFYWDYGDGATWDSLYVGYGLFSNWRYFTIGDGYP